VTLDPSLTIREAMDLFTSKRISGAPVVAGGKVIGVVSASDLLQFAASLPGVPTQRDLTTEFFDEMGDVETDDLTPDPDEDTTGVFFTELWDDAGASVVERMAEPATAEWNSLEEHTVAEAMTRPPVHALTPETLVTVAADYMRRVKIHRVLVMVGKQLIGVATTSDITDAVADGKLTAQTYVFDRRTLPVRPIRPRRR
jgi:CBS domain-containing protein